MRLYNKVDRRILKAQLDQDDLERITLSYYKYYQLGNPLFFRDYLYLKYSEIDVMGRVYVAYEGVNAQISVPKTHWTQFAAIHEDITFLHDNRLNIARQDDGKSFYKLKIKVRPKIVADGLNDANFDVTNAGKHLDAQSFNALTDKEKETLVVDMRNHYESEIGHFKNALKPDVDTFRDALPEVLESIKDKKDKNIVMYCTGGIRCEKASAWFKHQGFENVFQLEGGIIEYARQVEEEGLENKFIGKNFVFDERLGERISEEIIAQCHQCGEACDSHTNCKNEACHLLFIQCETCAKKLDGCCTTDCQSIYHLPIEEQRELRKGKIEKRNIFKKGRSEVLKFKK